MINYNHSRVYIILNRSLSYVFIYLFAYNIKTKIKKTFIDQITFIPNIIYLAIRMYIILLYFNSCLCQYVDNEKNRFENLSLSKYTRITYNNYRRTFSVFRISVCDVFDIIHIYRMQTVAIVLEYITLFVVSVE